MAVVKKRRDLSLSEKINVLKRYDKLPRTSQRIAAAQLNVSQPVLCKILKNRIEIEEAVKKKYNLNVKRNRSGKDAQVESELKLWFANVRENDEQVDGQLLRQKAKELANKLGKEHFVATEGWFYRWKKRENIKYNPARGKKKNGDFDNNDDEGQIEENDMFEGVICKDVKTSSNIDQKSNDTVTKVPPTKKEMRKALEVLRRGVKHRTNDLQIHNNYETFINNLLLKKHRQSTLDEFFQ